MHNGSNCLGLDERPSQFIDLQHVEEVRELEIDIALCSGHGDRCQKTDNNDKVIVVQAAADELSAL